MPLLLEAEGKYAGFSVSGAGTLHSEPTTVKIEAKSVLKHYSLRFFFSPSSNRSTFLFKNNSFIIFIQFVNNLVNAVLLKALLWCLWRPGWAFTHQPPTERWKGPFSPASLKKLILLNYSCLHVPLTLLTWSVRTGENMQCVPDSPRTLYNQDLKTTTCKGIFWCKTAHTDTEGPQMDNQNTYATNWDTRSK